MWAVLKDSSVSALVGSNLKEAFRYEAYTHGKQVYNAGPSDSNPTIYKFHNMCMGILSQYTI